MNTFVYSEIRIGQEESFTKEITLEMENSFREITGDENPLHKDNSFATGISQGRYKQHITFGMLTASLLSTLAGEFLPGKYSLIHSIDNIKFKNPVFAGDILTVTGIVEDKQDGLNLILVKTKIINQDSQTVLNAHMKILVQQ